MGYRVRLLRSGREFEAEASDTLLEAALRGGLNLRYHCANGSCGECGARVVTGRVEETRFHDFVLSESQKLRGEVLLCSVAAGSDVVIDAAEVDDVGAVPRQTIATRVTKLERLSADSAILHLRTPRTQTLQFLAGQHVALEVADVGTADLFIASCPCNGMNLQFHLLRDEDEPLIDHLLAHTRVGDTITVDGPFGDFVLDPDVTRPLVLVAEGDGFAPVKSLIEQAINLELTQPVSLYRMVADVGQPPYLDNLCRSWVQALDHFEYQRVSARPQAVAETIASRHCGDGCEIYLSGGFETRRSLAAELATRVDERAALHVADSRDGRRRVRSASVAGG